MIALAFLLWVCVFWPMESRAQTPTPTGVHPVYLVDDNGEPQYFGPGVCMVNSNNYFVFSGAYGGGAQAAVIEVEGQVLWLDHVDSAGDVMSMWVIQEDSLSDLTGCESAFLQAGTFGRNDPAMVYYHYVPDGELSLGGMEVAVRGTVSEGDTALLELDDYPTEVLYPASVVNGQGQILGVMLGDNICVLVGEQIEGTAQGNAGNPGEQGTATAPPLPERPGALAGDGGISSDGSGTLSAAVLVGIIVAVIVLVILILVLAGKKKQPGRSPAGGTPGNAGTVSSPSISAPSPGYGTPKGDGKAAADRERQSGKLWLIAKGGCMNGRVYPVEQSEITIGRDASMVIRFPADTVGVSRIHAKLYWQGGRLMLMDCNSTSGTFLKRQGKLTPMAPVAVQGGDVFYIGEKINSFEISTGE